MSITTEIVRLQNAKAGIKTAIEAKGVTVPSGTTLDGYAELVSEIQQGSSAVGELTLYKKITITPSAATNIAFDNPFNIAPKFIFISCSENSQPRIESGYIIDMAINFSTIGGVSYNNASMVMLPMGEKRLDDSQGNGVFGFKDNKIRINRYNASAQWSTETEYTVEIYA